MRPPGARGAHFFNLGGLIFFLVLIFDLKKNLCSLKLIIILFSTLFLRMFRITLFLSVLFMVFCFWLCLLRQLTDVGLGDDGRSVVVVVMVWMMVGRSGSWRGCGSWSSSWSW